MERDNSCKFMIVDSDSTNIMVSELIIGKVIKNPQIKSFTLPQLALKYIEEEYDKAEKEMPTLLLLNLYMSTMDGFEFLDNFLNFSANIKDQFKIVALSSLKDKWEMHKVIGYPYVIDYRTKPLTREILLQLLKESGYSI